MKGIVACEESQVVTMAFRELGHEFYSCDLLPCSGGHPEWHIQDDVLNHLDDGWDLMIAHPVCTYLTVTANKWLKDQPARKSGALVGAARRDAQKKAIEFFMRFVDAPIDKIAIENPVSIIATRYRPADQIIQPWQFGDAHLKKTCLWLKNLPKLRFGNEVQMMFGENVPPQSEIVEPEYVVYHSKTNKENTSKYPMAWSGKVKETKMPLLWKMSPGAERTKLRSQTFPGIAKAMAEQWGTE